MKSPNPRDLTCAGDRLHCCWLAGVSDQRLQMGKIDLEDVGMTEKVHYEQLLPHEFQERGTSVTHCCQLALNSLI